MNAKSNALEALSNVVLVAVPSKFVLLMWELESRKSAVLYLDRLVLILFCVLVVTLNRVKSASFQGGRKINIKHRERRPRWTTTRTKSERLQWRFDIEKGKIREKIIHENVTNTITTRVGK
ncbi:hypothetical protein [Echinococcus multilocularis]|uniref:Uncharacterized protein n=1 Tax=Echinococcus multilocularis TaxID=6211 RepID=A0A068Y5K2_ECHMU|nr:hypothetical protein [Echinococcus multilocularis]